MFKLFSGLISFGKIGSLIGRAAVLHTEGYRFKSYPVQDINYIGRLI